MYKEPKPLFGIKNFLAAYPVSHETLDMLCLYHDLLGKWQKAINLVSPLTLGHAWERHILDSAQLSKHIPLSTKTLVDMGSGAGFPGMVLAILRPDINIHLIESDARKCEFLRTVSRETSTLVSIHNARIEAVEGLMPDAVTARALADLKMLFDYTLPWAQENNALEMLFLKGANANQEIMAARQHYNFSCKTLESCSDPQGQILHITSLKCGQTG